MSTSAAGARPGKPVVMIPVWIDEDEYWPYYYLDRDARSTNVEVDIELLERFEELAIEFDELQRELKKIYDDELNV